MRGADERPLLSPSIESGPRFAVHLAQLVDQAMPLGMTCTVIADIQGGSVEAVRLGERGLLWVEFGEWARVLRLWLQARTPMGWWGSLCLRVVGGRLTHVVIRRTVSVGGGT